MYSDVFLLELKTDPLRFKLTIPNPDGDPKIYYLPVDAVSGQLLVLALLRQHEIADKLLPETLDAISASAKESEDRDTAFLKSVGVAARVC